MYNHDKEVPAIIVPRYRFNSSVSHIIALFLLLMGLRLMVALFIDTLFDVDNKVEFYYLIGENLAQGNGYVLEPGGHIVLHRAPLYPFLLACLYRLLGETSLLSILFVQAAFDAGTGLLIWMIGTRLLGNKIALIAAFLFTLYPLSAYYTLRLTTESIYTFVLLAMIASLVYAVSSEKRRVFLLAGMLGGVLALVRPIGIGLIPFLAVSLWVREYWRLRTIAPKLIYFILGFIIILTPWVVRNYLLTGHVILSTTGSGMALWVGTNVRFDGRDANEMHDLDEINAWHQERIAIDEQGEDCYNGNCFILFPAQDQAFARVALKDAISHPMASLILFGKKTFRFWFSIYMTKNQHAQVFVYLLQGILLFFAAYGILRTRQNQPAAFIPLAVIIYTALIHSLIISSLRYSIPLVPILMIFATAGLWDAGHRIVGRFYASKIQVTTDGVVKNSPEKDNKSQAPIK